MLTNKEIMIFLRLRGWQKRRPAGYKSNPNTNNSKWFLPEWALLDECPTPKDMTLQNAYYYETTGLFMTNKCDEC